MVKDTILELDQTSHAFKSVLSPAIKEVDAESPATSDLIYIREAQARVIEEEVKCESNRLGRAAEKQQMTRVRAVYTLEVNSIIDCICKRMLGQMFV